MLIAIICAGKSKILSTFPAPKYCAIMAEMAERVWARIHTIAEIKDPAMPTAASASVGFKLIFPTIAVSVIDNKGSAIPEIMAGMASLLILPNEILEI
jgi:hypothetical protein